MEEEEHRRDSAAIEELVITADSVKQVLQQQLGLLQAFQQQILTDANLVQLKIKSILSKGLQEQEGWILNYTATRDCMTQSVDCMAEQDSVCRPSCTGPLDSAVYSLKSHESLCCLGNVCTNQDEEKKCMKCQKLNENKHIQRKLKSLQVAVTTDLKAVNIEHVLNVQDMERSVFHCEKMIIQVQPDRKENLLCKNKIAQLWIGTKNILEKNAQLEEEIKTLKIQKNMNEQRLARAEDDGEYYVMELKKIISKCEDFLIQRKLIEDERNLLLAERGFMMKMLHDKDEYLQMQKALAESALEKEELTEHLKSTRCELLCQIEQKQQLQIKLGRTLMENILLKEHRTVAQTQRMRTILTSGLDDRKQMCQDFASFRNNELALGPVSEKSLVMARCSFNNRFQPDDDLKEHVLHELNDLKAKNMMVWFRFCDSEQEYNLVARLVQCLKKENNMLFVELEGRVISNQQLQRRFKDLKDKICLMDRYMTTLEDQLETFKHNLQNIQERYHIRSQGIVMRKDIGRLREETFQSVATCNPAKEKHISALSPESACPACTEDNADTLKILHNNLSNVTVSASALDCVYRDTLNKTF